MELYAPARPRGRFVKGNIPYNKNKSWDDIKKPKKLRRKILRNLRKQNKGNPKLYEYLYKKVVMLKDDKIIGVFKSSKEVEEKLGFKAASIRRTCRGKYKQCGGFQWKYEIDIK